MTDLFTTLTAGERDRLRTQAHPEWVAPMLATLTERRFSDPAWVFERKFDGERCLGFRRGSEIRLMSRNARRVNSQRLQPEARPASEGVYAIVCHGDHTHLVYALELPEHAGAVQQEPNIESEASYIATVKNPETPTPPGVGLSPSYIRDYPDRLRARFDGRRFAPADPELLDYEGTELVLISAGEELQEELGIHLDAEEESAHRADVFRQLGLKEEHHPRQPLFGGEWR